MRSLLRAKTRWLRRFSTDGAAGNAVEAGPPPVAVSPSLSSLHPVIRQLLAARGLDTPEKMAAFLRPSPEQLRDPYGLKGMAEAVQLIKEALRAGRRIAVYGDYDADGVTSAALLARTLRRLGAEPSVCIPDRFREGYGLHADAVRRLAGQGVELLLTVDTGISNAEEVALAKELGMTVVITDHHEPPPKLPAADAVINPKQPGCPYPFKQLAGVGVAFKLAQALLSQLPSELWQLAAVGTISDLMPLVDENRVLAAVGLAEMNRLPLPGIAAVARQARFRGPWDSEAVGFLLGPRLNAAGRLAHAEGAYRLLMAEDETAAAEDAAWLEQLNRRRQQLVEEVVEAAQRQLARYDAAGGRFAGDAAAYVLAGHGWHEGVLGIAAARLVEKYYRPFVLLAVDEETGLAKGSARGVPGLDLYAAVAACREWLEKFGGHAQAAGMSLMADNIDPFRRAFAEEVERRWDAAGREPSTEVELYCPLEMADMDLWEALQRLEPYGIGNPKPIIYFGSVEIEQVAPLGKEQRHVKFFLRSQNGRTVEAVGFHSPDWAQRVAPGSKGHFIGHLGINEWNGQRRLQIFIKDMAVFHRQVFDWRRTPENAERWQRASTAGDNVYFLSFSSFLPPASAEPEAAVTDLVLLDVPSSEGQLAAALRRFSAVERLYCVFRPSPMAEVPGRQHFALLFRWMRQEGRFDRLRAEQAGSRLGLAAAQTVFVLQVFQELGFLLPITGQGYELRATSRSRLENSLTYLEAVQRQRMGKRLHGMSTRQLQQYMFDLWERQTREDRANES